MKEEKTLRETLDGLIERYRDNPELAAKTVDEMLRQRKDKMRITDCLAISGVLKHAAKLESETASLRTENEKLRRALEVYANPSNWIGCKKPFGELQKDWCGKGNGFDLAASVLAEEK